MDFMHTHACYTFMMQLTSAYQLYIYVINWNMGRRKGGELVMLFLSYVGYSVK